MMEKTKLESLLSTCFELEGLLTLAINRGEETPEAIYESIKSKINVLSNDYCLVEQSEPSSELTPEVAEEISASVEFEEENDADIPQPAATPKTEASQIKTETKRTKFAINDRYQFIRELFNGNEADFKDAVEALDEMESPDEMSDYLYNDLCLNEQDPVVAHFITIMMASKKHE